MPIVHGDFRPAWFARGGHAQTLWAPLARRPIPLPLRRERFELPDGDFLDLDWLDLPGDGPIVILLHGLQGSSRSPYIRGMMLALHGAGFRAVTMHFRGCGGEPNRLPRAYHSGDTTDLARLVEHLQAREPASHPAAIGYSLGANVLLKWLGETGSDNPLALAVAVSPPFDLSRCSDHLGQGFSRIYQRHLLTSLLRAVEAKHRSSGVGPPISPEELSRLRTIRQFDHHITAPLHGFAGAQDYYTRSSCRPFLRRIQVPTLILHAHDDPFVPPQAIPTEEELSHAVTLELSDGGGHVGFVGAPWPRGPRYWLEQRVPEFLAATWPQRTTHS